MTLQQHFNKDLAQVLSTLLSGRTGFDSSLAPKEVEIERCGEDNKNCIKVDGHPTNYRKITGYIKRMSIESGKSSEYGDVDGNYKLSFLYIQTDDGLLIVKLGKVPKPNVACKNILTALRSASFRQLEGLITFRFDPNLGVTEREQKVVNVKAFDEQGNELRTIFEKQKGQDQSALYQYWLQALDDAYNKVNRARQTNYDTASLRQGSVTTTNVQQPKTTPQKTTRQSIAQQPKDCYNTTIGKIRQLTGHDKDIIVSACKNIAGEHALSPNKLNQDQFEQLLSSLCVGYALSFEPPIHGAEEEIKEIYNAHFSQTYTRTKSYLETAKSWISQVQELAEMTEDIANKTKTISTVC